DVREQPVAHDAALPVRRDPCGQQDEGDVHGECGAHQSCSFVMLLTSGVTIQKAKMPRHSEMGFGSGRMMSAPAPRPAIKGASFMVVLLSNDRGQSPYPR